MLLEFVIANVLFVYANFQLSQRARLRLSTLDKNLSHPKSLQLNYVHQFDSSRITSASLLINSDSLYQQCNHWWNSFIKTKFEGSVSRRPIYRVVILSYLLSGALPELLGCVGLLPEACHLGKHWVPPSPSFHICILKIIINILRAVIKIKEVVVCQL